MAAVNAVVDQYTGDRIQRSHVNLEPGIRGVYRRVAHAAAISTAANCPRLIAIDAIGGTMEHTTSIVLTTHDRSSPR